jgi:hypothetical protein
VEVDSEDVEDENQTENENENDIVELESDDAENNNKGIESNELEVVYGRNRRAEHKNLVKKEYEFPSHESSPKEDEVDADAGGRNENAEDEIEKPRLIRGRVP